MHNFYSNKNLFYELKSIIFIGLQCEYNSELTQAFYSPGKIVKIGWICGTSTLWAVQSSCKSIVGAFCSTEIVFSIFVTHIVGWVSVGGTVCAILILESGIAKIVDFSPRAGWVFNIVQNN